RLLVEADQRGFPLNLLNDPTSGAGRLDWRDRVTRVVIDALAEGERMATHPTGGRRWVRTTLSLLAKTRPEIPLVATAAHVLWDLFVNGNMPGTVQLLLIAIVPLVVIIVLHLFILLLLPVRWPAIRGEFLRRLDTRLTEELGRSYLPIPGEIAAALQDERK